MGYADLNLHFFGGLQVELGGEPVRGFRSQKIASLLAYLVYRRDRAHPREVLLETFWPEVDAGRAYTSLRQAVYQLRRLLGKEAILARDRTLRLHPGVECRCDVHEFQALLEAARRAPEAERVYLRERAVSLYRGRFLDGFYEDWVLVEAERLQDLYLQALRDLLRDHRARGHYARALECGRRALELAPRDEGLHRDAMELYGALGRRDAALEQYEVCRRLLREDLGIEPGPEIEALRRRIASGEGLHLEVEHEPPHSLPAPLTSFVGRQGEVRALCRTMQSHRLVTLVGPGGVGKTRLALEAAWTLQGRLEDGVGWAELASVGVSVPEGIPQAVAAALGVREDPDRPLSDALACTLRPQRLLLVLDNCEHLLDALADFLVPLLSSCPALRVLATSRQRLGLPGERVWEVKPLELPPPGATPQALERYDAVRLFVERVRDHQPDFAPEGTDAEVVHTICRRLDGLPLALELAAVRVRSLPLEALVARLDDRFRSLPLEGRGTLHRPPRTLQATMDWSYQLLPPDEQRLLRRISVFAGEVPLEVIETVCSGDGLAPRRIADLLSNLVDKSLVRFETDRYGLLETVRRYARERLEAAGEEESVCARHLNLFRERAEQGERGLLSPEELLWLHRLREDAKEFRAALQEAFRRGETEAALRLICALQRFWFVTGRVAEGSHWTGMALRQEEAETQATIPPALRARLRLGAVQLLSLREGDHRRAVQALLEEAVRLLRGCGAAQEEMLAYALLRASNGAVQRGDRAGAEALQREAIAIYRRRRDLRGVAVALNYRGNHALQASEVRAARRAYEEALALNRRLGQRHEESINLVNLGELAELEGDKERAGRYYRESLAIRRELGAHRSLGVNLVRIAGVLASQDPRRAARLLGAAYETLEACGASLGLETVMFSDRTIASLKAALGEVAFREEVQRGRGLDLSTAVALASEGPVAPPTARDPDRAPVSLPPPEGIQEAPRSFPRAGTERGRGARSEAGAKDRRSVHKTED